MSDTNPTPQLPPIVLTPRPAQAAPCCCSGACHSHTDHQPPPLDDGPIAPTAHVDTFGIEAMDCPMEEAMIRKALGGMAGIAGLRFNLLARELTVHHDLPDTAPIIAAIAALGMEAVPRTVADKPGLASKPDQWLTPRLILALTLAVAAEVTDGLGLAAPWLPAALAASAVALGGLSIFRKGVLALRHANLNINALMTVAACGATALGQYAEAAMVVTLFTLAERLESASLTRARNAVAALLALAPPEATVRQDSGDFAAVPAGSVPVGATVRLRPGERVALDGEVSGGHSAVDQSPITGESLPVAKGPGDALFAGSINREGELLYVTTALADDSTLARITRAVVASPGKRAPMERFIDRFAAVYTPSVFAVALAVAVLPPLLWHGATLAWIYKALVILVIACPCALVIATPVTIVSALAAAARHGILIKGGLFLERGHALTLVALDKTGTVTTGRPEVTDTQVVHGETGTAYALAASLASRSDHPVSRAVAASAARDGIVPVHVADFTALPGLGVTGTVEGRRYHFGNPRLLTRLGRLDPAIGERVEALEHAGKTAVLLADDTRVLALFAVADVVREHSRRAVAELADMGVETVLLSGDAARVTADVASDLGVGEARGELLPEAKVEALTELRKRAGGKGLVGMVGDGINDAPALARADIGFAMAAAGSDVAIETADVAIMDDDLRKIPVFMRLSRTTGAVLRQNIALALGLKGLVLAATVCGYGTMLLAVFADMGTSLLVIANGLRLLRK